MNGNNQNDNNLKEDRVYELNPENLLNDENIIPICIKNILESTLEENIENRDFLREKNNELNNFIERNIQDNITHDGEEDKYKSDDDLRFMNINKNAFFLNNQHNFEDAQVKGNEESVVPNSSISSLKNEKKRNKRKRKYIDINQINYDFEEDFSISSDDELVRRKSTYGKGTKNDSENGYPNVYQGEYQYVDSFTDECPSAHGQRKVSSSHINMNSQLIRSLITPPPIPFNDTFKKYNKEISEMFTKYKKKGDSLNIFLASQFLCIEEEEDAFANEHSFISKNFDNFIMNKLNAVSSTSENANDNSVSKEDKDLQELLKYLMSWYFSGFYSGKMSILKELHRQ
ncbi:conserved Plasmodium protein, unknown function [Plasmodium ovale]|uniref:Uncharacterized protein n=2 Tax=Plasmodium ovale TaxID=36330 RepID=A0A1A8WL82_PLAOA|nr:hypothetical protein, conserved [Plasmodium ovale curtisi]SBS93692.1 hypothetical protein, conserved [Plasmodium ovale curtisi]SCP04900.1 conserved Plasmodium protein, unknown function [Plasmodium ovale]